MLHSACIRLIARGTAVVLDAIFASRTKDSTMFLVDVIKAGCSRRIGISLDSSKGNQSTFDGIKSATLAGVGYSSLLINRIT